MKIFTLQFKISWLPLIAWPLNITWACSRMTSCKLRRGKHVPQIIAQLLELSLLRFLMFLFSLLVPFLFSEPKHSVCLQAVMAVFTILCFLLLILQLTLTLQIFQRRRDKIAFQRSGNCSTYLNCSIFAHVAIRTNVPSILRALSVETVSRIDEKF